eukprot:6841119-Pyramimonas_sp.AAC.1
MEIDELERNSVCKACDQKGHWKGDPECPKSLGSSSQHTRRSMLAIHDGSAVDAEPHTVMATTTGTDSTQRSARAAPTSTTKPKSSSGFYLFPLCVRFF